MRQIDGCWSGSAWKGYYVSEDGMCDPIDSGIICSFYVFAYLILDDYYNRPAQLNEFVYLKKNKIYNRYKSESVK